MDPVKKYKKTVGSHAEVFHGTAKHTSGGLTKNDLMKNKRGEIVSKKKHELGLKIYKKNEDKRLLLWKYYDNQDKLAPPFRAGYKCKKVKSPKKATKKAVISPVKKHYTAKKSTKKAVMSPVKKTHKK